MSAVKGRTRAGWRFRAARPPSRWRSAMVAASMVTSTRDCRTSGRTANRVSEPGSLCPGIIGNAWMEATPVVFVTGILAPAISAWPTWRQHTDFGVNGAGSECCIHRSKASYSSIDSSYPHRAAPLASTSIHWLPSTEATPKKSGGLFTNAHSHPPAKTIDHCREPYAQARGQQPDLIIRISHVRSEETRHGNRDAGSSLGSPMPENDDLQVCVIERRCQGLTATVRTPVGDIRYVSIRIADEC